MCKRWNVFESFFADMGARPSPRHTLDRIDNSRGYEPENCRWATPAQQGENKRNNRLIEFNGERLSLGAWCRRLGMKKSTLRNRLGNGWPVERALTELSHAKVNIEAP